MEFSRLFTPITINGLELKNRIVMPAIHMMYTPDGHVNDRSNHFYWRRAEGGVGLVIVGGCRFDDHGFAPAMISLRDDSFIPGLKEFTDGMHERGAKVGVQLYHAGAYAHSFGLPIDKEPLAPSEVFSKFSKEMPSEITTEEIKELIDNWAAASIRAKEAGFDLVEIIASAGYLICQFLSPLKNLRTDEYGGSWENRTRFACEVVAAVREAVGEDYPLCMRISGHDFVEGSNTNVEAIEFCKLMEECGIDMLNVTGGWHETVVPQLTGEVSRAGYAYLAAGIKDAVSIPVSVSNRINNPVVAEKLLATGVSDMVSLCRPNLADPDWALKAEEGRPDEIRHCVACNQGCLAKSFFGMPVECLVNASVGQEYLLSEMQVPETKRSILVVGAGPAGCEFAVNAATQGHKVQLWDEASRIGGQLFMVATPPGKEEFSTLAQYYSVMLDKLGVEVVLNKRASADEIASGNFDLVVTATGMIPNTIPLPGKSTLPVYTAYEVLRDDVIPGRDIVVIGGGSVGCETAQYLAHDASISSEMTYFLLQHQAETVEKVLLMMNSTRRNISIVDIAKIGAGFDRGTWWPVKKDLESLNAKLYSFSPVTDIDDSSVCISVTDKATGESSEVRIPCDTIILSVGAKPNDVLFQELQERGINSLNIGDSSKIGKVIDAIKAGRVETAQIDQAVQK